ncbi:DUF2255 family protein [Streptomyces odontomachi]|uniref:DUF2255 family protein n=1 Tax=Streptomyces odontomachi TaxID=2944940 RepID=UPI002108BAB8|nr:DUF2255 family protein [Streptomyces sp. ODS25]
MTTWSREDLDRIATTDELQVAPQQDDGTLRSPTTVWVVRDGDDVYVRSYRGASGHWFRTAQTSHAGHITCDGVDTDVTFAEEPDPTVNDRVDTAYRSKYRQFSEYVAPMVAAGARATTLKLLPR